MVSYSPKFGPAELIHILNRYLADPMNGTTILPEYSTRFFDGKGNLDPSRSTIITDIGHTVTSRIQIEHIKYQIEEIAKKGVRDALIEIGGGASRQCKLLYDHAVARPTTCFLCGFPLQIGTKEPAMYSDFSNECEHVLPAGAALIFHDIVVSSDDFANADDVKYMNKNYSYAHRICNGIKKDKLFITLFDSAGNVVHKPVINESVVDEYLQTLFSTEQILKLCRTSRITPADALARAKRVLYEKLTPLLQDFEGSLPLRMLSGTATLEKNIDYFYSKTAGPGFTPLKFPAFSSETRQWFSKDINTQSDYRTFRDLATAKINGPEYYIPASAIPMSQQRAPIGGRTLHKRAKRRNKKRNRKTRRLTKH